MTMASGGRHTMNTGRWWRARRRRDQVWFVEKDRQGCSHLYPLLDHYRMGYMSTKTNTTLSESEIDQIVIAQADDDAAWEPLIQVERSTPALLSLPGDLAMRATFLAQLHRTKSVEEWLTRVIQERIELEESLFIGIKQRLSYTHLMSAP